MSDDPRALDERLRRSGASWRDDAAGWRTDAADVAARSTRQRTTARRALGAAAAVLVLLGVGVVVRGGSGDEHLRVAGMGTEVPRPTTTRPVTVTTTAGFGPTGPAATTTSTPGVTTTTTTRPDGEGPVVTRPSASAPSAPTTTGDDREGPTGPGGPGGPDATTTTTTPTTTTTTRPTIPTPPTTTAPVIPAPAGVELRDDGLGVATLGVDGDDAAIDLSRALGSPRIDTGWLMAPGVGLYRNLVWGPAPTSPGSRDALVVRLTFPPPGFRRFTGYTYCPTPGFFHLLLPGGIDPGPGCFSRSLD